MIFALNFTAYLQHLCFHSYFCYEEIDADKKTLISLKVEKFN